MAKPGLTLDPRLIPSIRGLEEGATSPGTRLQVSDASQPPGILENHRYAVLPAEIRIQLIQANAWAVYILKAPRVTVKCSEFGTRDY